MKLFLFYCLSLINFTEYIDADQKRIDRQLAETEMWLNEGKAKEYFLINEKIFNESEKISYSKGITLSGYRLAMVLFTSGKFKESLEFLIQIEEQEYIKNNDEVKADIFRLEGENKRKLGLHEAAITSHKKILMLKLDPVRLNLEMAYNNIGANFIAMKMADSAFFYYTKAYQLLKKPVSAKQKTLLSVICINIGDYWNEKKNNVDTAKKFYLKGVSLATDAKSYFALQLAFETVGKMYYRKGLLDSSLIYNHKSLQIASSAGFIYERKNLYKVLSDTYKLKKNNVKYLKFLSLYANLSDSLDRVEKKNLPKIFKALTTENEKKFKGQTTTLNLIIFISVFIILIITYVAYSRYKIQLTQQRKHSEDEKKFIDTLSAVKKTIATENLTELIKLAKNSDKAFLVKFNELYPEFIKKLLLKAPTLTPSELEICYYKKINFDTKEIARYANMTIKSVESKQYRIKKKIGLLQDERLSIWIANI